MSGNKANISFNDLVKAVFDKNGNLNAIRFQAVDGTGRHYTSCGKKEPYETILKKLIGIDDNGCTAIRFIEASTTGACDNVVGCKNGSKFRSNDELILGSIELATDGLPAIRMTFQGLGGVATN